MNIRLATRRAILVFGTTEDNGTPSPELQARLDQALALWRKDRAPWMVVTGGKRPGDEFHGRPGCRRRI